MGSVGFYTVPGIEHLSTRRSEWSIAAACLNSIILWDVGTAARMITGLEVNRALVVVL